MAPSPKCIPVIVLLLAAAVSSRAAEKPAKYPEKSQTAAAKRWMRSLSLREKAAQLFILPFFGESPNSRSQEFRKYLRWVRELRIGGLILVNRIQYGRVIQAEPNALAVFLNRMQRASKTPLLVASDFERGASMRVNTQTKFPHSMAFAATRDPDLTRFEGMTTAREARALGVHWILAPDADVNSNPDNPIINVRSYGENPDEVAAHVDAYIAGAHEPEQRVLTTAKHFPGHGDTSVDTHLGLATIQGERERLDRVELAPFRSAIASGVDSVMTAHIAVPSLGSPDLPATLSRSILTDLLRKELNFKGLIVTDALDMQGVAKTWTPAESAVKAFEAGADVLLMPPNPEEAIEAIVSAVQGGRIKQSRLDESVLRILAAKLRLGLGRKRLVDIDAISDELNSPEALERVQEIADRSVTVVTQANLMALRPGAKPCFVVLNESCCSSQGRVFQDEIRKRNPKAQISMLDPGTTDEESGEVIDSVAGCDTVTVAAFASVAAYRGSVALAGSHPATLNGLIDTGKPVALISLGNPYLVRSFPGASAYMATYSTVPSSEIAAVKALYGEIPIKGRLPVTIPGIAQYGDGIQTPAASN